MKKLAEWQVDNVVAAQPLFIGTGPKDPMVLVATSNNELFAFSPSQTKPTG